MTYADMRELSLLQINQYSIAGTRIADSYDNQADYVRRIPALVNAAMLDIARVRPIEETVLLSSLKTNKDDLPIVTELTPTPYGNCVRAGEDGRAPSGLPIGTLVITSGGVYKITAVGADGTYTSEQFGVVLDEEDLELVPPLSAVQHTVENNEPTMYILPDDFIDVVPSGLLWIYDGNRYNITDYTVVSNSKLWVAEPNGGTLYLRYRRNPHLLSSTPADEDVIDLDPMSQQIIPIYVGAKLIMEDDAFLYASLYNEWLTKLNNLVRTPRVEHNTVPDVYGFSGWGDY